MSRRALLLCLTLALMTCVRSQATPAWQDLYQFGVTESFMSKNILARAAELQNKSMKIVIEEGPPIVTETTREEDMVRIVFGAMHANNSEFSKFGKELHPPLWGSYNSNKNRYLRVFKRVNEPFVDAVPITASRLADFIGEAFNDSDTSKGRQGRFSHAVLFFPGGAISVSDYSITREHSLSQNCRTIEWFKNQTLQASVRHFEFYRQFPPQESVLLAMNSKNAPSFCGGSGVVFADHGEMNQRSWGDTAYYLRSTLGTVTNDDLNDGNSIVPLRPQDRFNLEKLYDYGFRTHPSRIQDIIREARFEYYRGLEQYDNVPFLILSVTAILSSAAVASVSPGREMDRIVIILVEAGVVYSFLAIVTRAAMVLLRKEAYSFDILMENYMNFTFGNEENIILAKFEYSIAIVGTREKFPMRLVITEVVSVFAALTVTWTLVVTFASIKSKRKPKVLPSGDAESEEVEWLEKVVFEMDDMSESGGDLEKISVVRKIRNKISSVRR